MPFGNYPEVSLAEARAMCDDARRLMREGKNPIEERRAQRKAAEPAETFEQLAHEWYGSKSADWSESHKTKVRRLLHNFLLPKLARRPAKEITTTELKSTIDAILDKSAKGRRESAKETLRIARQIFDYACGTRDEFMGRNIAAPLISNRIFPAPQVTHYAAVRTPEELGPIIKAIRAYQGGRVVKTALELVPILMLRQINICKMRWEKVDLESATLLVPRAELKVKDREGDLICPLPKQAIKLLKDLRPFTDTPACGGWCFPGGRQRDRHISNNALRSALISLGIHEQQSIHGFRSAGETILLDYLHYPKAWVEVQLDHGRSGSPLGDTYDRSQYLEQRKRMLQEWADFLDKLAGNGS